MYTQTLIEDYPPQNEQEAADRALMRSLLRHFGDALLRRDCTCAHFTASSIVLSLDCKRVLMAYHNLYQSWAWTGGHADGQDDPLSVAIREAREETGVTSLTLLSPHPVALDVLPVWGHVKHGTHVSTHLHLNITYAFTADPSAPLRIKDDENSRVGWLDSHSLPQYVSEPDMLPIYKKLLHRAFSLTGRTFFG